LSTQSAHRLGGRVLPDEHGALHGGGVVDAGGLTRQLEPIADRLLQLTPVIEAGAGRVE
jgi:hypothetical protein